MDDTKIQQSYYSQTASDYDQQHLSEEADVEHYDALAYLEGIIKQYKIRTILDVGAGTGRTIQHINNIFPDIIIKGVEPVKELREKGYEKGIGSDILLDGDGYKLDFADGSFDLVCEFAVLHHVKEPETVVKEMIRVSKIGIFISDSNNFGQGSAKSRRLKNLIGSLGLWKLYQFVVTKGKMYHISEGDGLFYSYSVFNNFKTIQKAFKQIQLLSYIQTGINPKANSRHIILFAHSKR